MKNDSIRKFYERVEKVSLDEFLKRCNEYGWELHSYQYIESTGLWILWFKAETIKGDKQNDNSCNS